MNISLQVVQIYLQMFETTKTSGATTSVQCWPMEQQQTDYSTLSPFKSTVFLILTLTSEICRSWSGSGTNFFKYLLEIL